MTNHPTDTQIDEAIKKLKGVIEAAENSNHSGEVALMKAVDAITKGNDAFPLWEETLGADDGGPAFPQNDLSGYGMGPSEINNGGMTLRQYYAGQALAGVASGFGNLEYQAAIKDVAALVFDIADAMIAQEGKTS